MIGAALVLAAIVVAVTVLEPAPERASDEQSDVEPLVTQSACSEAA
jgi:hypothetical protein